MTAVAQQHGAAHRAFVIVPLVCGFFIDIVNAGRAPGDGVGGRARSPSVAQRAAGVMLAAIAGLREGSGCKTWNRNGDDDDR